MTTSRTGSRRRPKVIARSELEDLVLVLAKEAREQSDRSVHFYAVGDYRTAEHYGGVAKGLRAAGHLIKGTVLLEHELGGS